MQILVAMLCGAVHQQQRAAAYAALLPSLVDINNKTKIEWNCISLHRLLIGTKEPLSTAID